MTDSMHASMGHKLVILHEYSTGSLSLSLSPFLLCIHAVVAPELDRSKARPARPRRSARVVERGVQYRLSLSLSPFLLCIHAALGSAGVATQADQVYQGQHAYAIMHMLICPSSLNVDSAPSVSRSAVSRSAVTHSRLYLLD
jgi:hypothetical protein